MCLLDSLLIIVNIYYPVSKGIVTMCKGHRCGLGYTANADNSAPMSVTEYQMPVCFASSDITHLAHVGLSTVIQVNRNQKMQFAF